jgi:hypothetical protein
VLEQWGEYGALGLAAGLSFALAREALQILREQVRSKKGEQRQQAPGHSALRCALHDERLEAIHQTVQGWDRNATDFQCAWKGRDEVRDLLEALRALSTQVANLSTQLQREANGRAHGG